MAEISFYARGDSTSANNAALNVQGTSTLSTTQLTFTSGASGDLQLDYAGGLVDPDTSVIIGGVTMSFTVIFSGNLPQTNKMSNVGGVDLRGEEIVVIRAENGQRYFFLTDGSGTLTIMDDFPNGATAIENTSTSGPVLICFVAGTLIATRSGEVPVESLVVGDLVLNAAGAEVPVRWIGKRSIGVGELMLHRDLRPIYIPPDYFGVGQPHTRLGLSAQHRVLVSGWEVELLFGSQTALVPAKDLLGANIKRGNVTGPVTYVHIMFDDHEIICSNGLTTESFQPGKRGVSAMDDATYAEFARIFPDCGIDHIYQRPDAARGLAHYEAVALLNTISDQRPKRGKVLAGRQTANNSTR